MRICFASAFAGISISREPGAGPVPVVAETTPVPFASFSDAGPRVSLPSASAGAVTAAISATAHANDTTNLRCLMDTPLEELFRIDLPGVPTAAARRTPPDSSRKVRIFPRRFHPIRSEFLRAPVVIASLTPGGHRCAQKKARRPKPPGWLSSVRRAHRRRRTLREVEVPVVLSSAVEVVVDLVG